MLRTIAFTETDDGLTYTGSVSVPDGARLLDVLIETTAAWAAATADLDVGDDDAADALGSGIDVSSQLGITIYNAGNGGGTNWGNGLTSNDGPYGVAGGPGKLYPNGGTITAVITATTPAAGTGETLISILLEPPGVHRAAVADPGP